MRRWRGNVLVVILAVAFALRLATALLWVPPLEADAADYHALATRLAGGHGYVTASGEPTSWRPPGYPFFLAGAYRVAGPSPTVARVMQAGVGTGVVAATYAVGALAVGPAVGLVAAGIAAVDPAQVAATSRLLSELLFTLLLVGGTACLLAALRGGVEPVGWAAGAGVLFGLGALTRGALIAYPVGVAGVLLAWPWVRRRRRRLPEDRSAPPRPALSSLVLLVTFAATLLPWTLRNHRVHQAVVPIATQMGSALYASQNPAGGYVMGVIPDDAVTRRAAGLSEVEASRYLTGEAVRSVAEDPGRLPRLETLKLLYFWVPLDWEILPWYGAFNAHYAFVLVWCGLALALAWRRRGPPADAAPPVLWPVWLPVLYFVAMALVFYGSPRFRMPLEPLLAVGAAAGLVGLGRLRGPGLAGKAAAASAAALLVLALAVDPLKDAARSLLTSVGLWG